MITYEEAYAKAKAYKPNIDMCTEYENSNTINSILVLLRMEQQPILLHSDPSGNSSI